MNNQPENLSHAVEVVTRYRIDGKEFNSHEAAIQARENAIEAFLRRPLLQVNGPRGESRFIEWVLANRAELRGLLDY